MRGGEIGKGSGGLEGTIEEFEKLIERGIS